MPIEQLWNYRLSYNNVLIKSNAQVMSQKNNFANSKISCTFAHNLNISLIQKIMNNNPVDKAVAALLQGALSDIEKVTNSDVLSYFGPIVDGNENAFLDIIEDLAKEADKNDTLSVVLTTPGGSAIAVERYVNIIRHFYKKVVFIVPDYAYSAGTIFCMSGDEIWMDFFSVLGPIDPQVTNRDGHMVPALGYLDKVNALIEKAQKGTLTQAEFLILKDFDLAELRSYEQAKELTIDLLKKWLVKYKFKNWTIHSSSNLEVTDKDKEDRAAEIAEKLGDNTRWKSHGRPINIKELTDLRLKIDDYSNIQDVRQAIRQYYNLLRDFTIKYRPQTFIQTRKFI